VEKGLVLLKTISWEMKRVDDNGDTANKPRIKTMTVQGSAHFTLASGLGKLRKSALHQLSAFQVKDRFAVVPSGDANLANGSVRLTSSSKIVANRP
jgi:hypothetical protein